MQFYLQPFVSPPLVGFIKYIWLFEKIDISFWNFSRNFWIISIFQLSEEEYWKLTFKEMTGREYSIRTNKKVRNENKIIIDEEYNFMIGNIDKRVVGENSILMCKAENIFFNKEWNGGKLPEGYILEAQHNMRVCKAEKCIIASIIDGKRLVYKEVGRNNKIIDMIIQIEKDFWENNILKEIPPK